MQLQPGFFFSQFAGILCKSGMYIFWADRH